MVCVHIDMGEHVEWYTQPNATLRGCLSSWRKGWGIFWLFNTEMLLQVLVTAGFGPLFFLILAVSTGSCVHIHGATAKKDRNSLASIPWHHCPPSNSFIFLKDCPLQRNFGNALNKAKYVSFLQSLLKCLIWFTLLISKRRLRNTAFTELVFYTLCFHEALLGISIPGNTLWEMLV